MTPAAAFDCIAARYDALWTFTAAGEAQRSLVWRNVDGLFRPGQRLLDLGCGTGVDAAHFRDLGIEVHAVDASPAMVEAARARGGFAASVRRAEEIGGIGKMFDGAISNFGVLNCSADVGEVAAGLARVVRPGGRVAICTLGRFCLWEMFYHPLRRIRGRAQASLGIAIRYPTVRQLAAAFAPMFRLQRWMGIGLLAPPSYVRLPDGLVRDLGRIDRAVAHLPAARAMADHRLLVFERR